MKTDTGDLMSVGEMPLVSVIVPYYSQGAYIAETIESIRRQTYPNIELIVVDDGSPAPHAAALAEITDLSVYRIPNGGPPNARNFGFRRSSGEFLVFCDADDVLPDEAIELNVSELLARPHASMVFGAAQVINANGEILVPTRVCLPRRNYFLLLLETNPIWSPGATMIRRSDFQRVGGFKSLRTFQTDDYELYLLLARHGDICQHDGCVLRYRQHESNMSRDRTKMLNATLDTLNRVASQQMLSSFELLQLRHGKMRWRYEFRDHPPGPLTTLKSLYFKIVGLWNIDVSYQAKALIRYFAEKCGCKPTRAVTEFVDSSGSTVDAMPHK